MHDLCHSEYGVVTPQLMDAGGVAGQTGPMRPRGVVQEIQALVVGFFTSLMPGLVFLARLSLQ